MKLDKLYRLWINSDIHKNCKQKLLMQAGRVFGIDKPTYYCLNITTQIVTRCPNKQCPYFIVWIKNTSQRNN